MEADCGLAPPEGCRCWLPAFAGFADVRIGENTSVAPLVASAAAHLLVATTLAVFPGNALTGPTIEDRHDAHPDTLRRAITFIDEHASTSRFAVYYCRPTAPPPATPSTIDPQRRQRLSVIHVRPW